MLHNTLSYRIHPAAHEAPGTRACSCALHPAHSPAWAYYDRLFSEFNNSLAGPRDITGAVIPVAVTTNMWQAEAAAFDDSYGILIGGLPWESTFEAVSMFHKFPNGTGTDEVLYLQATIVGYPPTIYSKTITISRTIRNDGITPLNVQEQALYTTDGANIFMVVYDAIPIPITLEIGVPYIAQYVLQTLYPQP